MSANHNPDKPRLPDQPSAVSVRVNDLASVRQILQTYKSLSAHQGLTHNTQLAVDGLELVDSMILEGSR